MNEAYPALDGAPAWALFGVVGFTCGLAIYALFRSVCQLLHENPVRKMWWAVLCLAVASIIVAAGVLWDIREDQLFGHGHDVVTYVFTVVASLSAAVGFVLALHFEARTRKGPR